MESTNQSTSEVKSLHRRIKRRRKENIILRMGSQKLSSSEESSKQSGDMKDSLKKLSLTLCWNPPSESRKVLVMQKIHQAGENSLHDVFGPLQSQDMYQCQSFYVTEQNWFQLLQTRQKTIHGRFPPLYRRSDQLSMRSVRKERCSDIGIWVLIGSVERETSLLAEKCWRDQFVLDDVLIDEQRLML